MSRPGTVQNVCGCQILLPNPPFAAFVARSPVEVVDLLIDYGDSCSAGIPSSKSR